MNGNARFWNWKQTNGGPGSSRWRITDTAHSCVHILGQPNIMRAVIGRRGTWSRTKLLCMSKCPSRLRAHPTLHIRRTTCPTFSSSFHSLLRSSHSLLLRPSPLDLIRLNTFVSTLPIMLVESKSFRLGLRDAWEDTHLQDDFTGIQFRHGANGTIQEPC